MNSDKKNNESLWWRCVKLYPKTYVGILICVILGAIPTLGLVICIPFAMRQLQNNLTDISWRELFGSQLAKYLEYFFKNSTWSSGISIDAQKSYFGITFALIALTACFFKIAQEWQLENMGEKLARDLRDKISSSFLSLPFSRSAKHSAELLGTLVGEDSREVRQTFTRLMGSVISDGLITVVYIIWLSFLDFQLFILFITVLIPAGIVIRITGKSLKQLARQGMNSQTELLGMLLERMKGWQTIQNYGTQNHELKSFNNSNSNLFHAWRRSARAKALGSPLVEWLGTLAAAFIIVVALRRIAEQALTSSILVQFLVTLGLLSNALQSLTQQLNSSKKGSESLRRIYSFIDGENSNKIGLMKKVSNHSIVKNINLNQVEIETPTGQLLTSEPLDLNLKCGDFLLLTGPSGSGKSTLLHCILGLKSSKNGFVLWNNAVPSNAEWHNYSHDITFLPQDPLLIEGSIIENILYPEFVDHKDKISEQVLLTVNEALKKSQLTKDLYSPAQSLSGGERQRLMFARGFYRNRNIWIIDEGTSALDSENEKSLMQELKFSAKNAIVIFVSHRKAVMQYATHHLDLNLKINRILDTSTVNN